MQERNHLSEQQVNLARKSLRKAWCSITELERILNVRLEFQMCKGSFKIMRKKIFRTNWRL